MELVARIDHGTRVTHTKMMLYWGRRRLMVSYNGTEATVAWADPSCFGGVATGYTTG
jgi:hypothetical protein